MAVNRHLVNEDIVSGALFVLVGAAFLYIGGSYSFGSMLRMGPGFFPVILSSLLIAVGALVLGRGWFQARARVSIAISPTVRILAAVAIFAFFTQRLGLYPTLPAVVLVAASASEAFRWRSAVPLAIALTVVSDLIFRVALDLPLPAFGPWLLG